MSVNSTESLRLVVVVALAVMMLAMEVVVLAVEVMRSEVVERFMDGLDAVA